MIAIGVTGMIASGKTTLSGMIAEKYKAVVFNADEVAKEIIREMKIDNTNIVGNPMKLYQIEHKIMPVFEKRLKEFLKAHKSDGHVVLDIALLFEFGLEKYCDVIINTCCEFDVRVKRVQKRPDMSIEKFMFLNNKQMNDEGRNSKADFVINTNRDPAKIERDLENVMGKIDAGDYSRH